MPQIIIDLTDSQNTRVLHAFGVEHSLARDATPSEIADELKLILRDVVLAVETNQAVQQAELSVASWE